MKAVAGLVVVAALASTAHADGQCSVEFVTAPDSVRASIEAYLDQEPHCSHAIQLRVVPTDDGQLYLMAIRPDGRVHERTVPNASAAAVLVASWVADDGTGGAREDLVDQPRIADAPSAAPSEAPLVISMTPREPERGGHLFTVGGLLGMSGGGGGGVRGEIDLVQHGILSFGVSGSISREYLTPWISGPYEVTSSRIMPELAVNVPVYGHLAVRASLAAGAAYRVASGRNPDPNTANIMPTRSDESWGRTGEAGVTMSYDLTPRLGVAVGAVMYYSKFDPSITGLSAGGVEDDFQLMAFGGARVRL